MKPNAPTSLFKFVNVRAPQRVNDSLVSTFTQLRPPKAFESELLKIVLGKQLDTRGEVRDAANGVLKGLEQDPLGLEFEKSIRTALSERSILNELARKNFEAAGGADIEDVLASNNFKRAQQNDWELFYCLAALGRSRSDAIRSIRVLAACDSLAETDEAEKMPPWSEVLTWRVGAPKALFPPIEPQKIKPPIELEDLKAEVHDLSSELKVLQSIERKVDLIDREFYTIGKGAKPDVIKTKKQPDEERKGDESPPKLEETGTIEPENWLVKSLTPDTDEEKGRFSKAEQSLLSRQRAHLLGNSERDGVAAMRNDLYRRTRDLLWMPKHALPAEIVANPDAKFLKKELGLPVSSPKSSGKISKTVSMPDLPRVHTLGIGDLIVVEEQVNRYELGEIAHIENVMASETRTRTHLRIAETETTQTTETEETTVDERSLQTTDRYELARESESQLESSFGMEAGIEVSAGYGPVSVTANTGISSSTSASSGTSTATTLARETVENAVSSVTKRVREEQVSRVLTRIEETNEHGFVNDSESHITGIYRWVDKYYTVRAVNYGRRLMLEMIVPEPAAGYVYASEMHEEEEPITPPPPPITYDPEFLNRNNYLDEAGIYGAVDAPPPPPEVIYLTKTLGADAGGTQTYFTQVEKIVTIPEGYATTNVYFRAQLRYGDWYWSEYSAGSLNLKDAGTTLTGVTESLSLAVSIRGYAFHFGAKIRCELMDHAYQDWQLKTWGAIKAAYDTSVTAYEEKIAARAIGAGVHIEGHSPEKNMEIIRNELKRSAIKFISDDMAEIIVNGAVRTNEEFDAADSTGDFDLAEARVEGRIIQFFEQAFEWHNMTFSLYPYFWARESEQHNKMLAEDADPLMANFIGAGAARVVVPVPEEYEDAVLNFFETNEIWEGGEPPMVDDPDYISIAEELKQGRTNSFNVPIHYEGAGTPPPFIVDEWEIKLPTILVQLQSDDTLPTFPVGLWETEAPTLLDAKAAETGTGADWRNSVVSLLTLYGVANADDPIVRRDFAQDNGYPGDAQADVLASVDAWTFTYVYGEVDLNGLP